MLPSERYRELVASGKLSGDPDQQRVVGVLDKLSTDIVDYAARRRSLFRLKRPAEVPRGLYIHGPVGRGKSMLMDLFFTAQVFEPKRRVHFHDFMADVHQRIALARSVGSGDPLQAVAAALSGQSRLICFDEFHVSDIADAMILGRLFAAMFAHGVIVVATSNRHPADLYPNGINRQLFLPAIELISRHMEIIRLEGPIDYRLAHLEKAQVYFSPLGADADGKLESVWSDLTGVGKGEPTELDVVGRKLLIKEQHRGVARFGFPQLCGANLGPQDYLALANAFHAIILQGVPKLSAARRDEAKRFTTLVDALYERHAKLICTAEVDPFALYTDGDGAFEFERTASRLVEMQTPAYLAKPHKPVPEPGTSKRGTIVPG